ncbi:hypothetical protein F2Q69_00028936 [Brassica cretica]|uniref:Uncharacterized protein n=1 Tax=Brassica cretica TaxID=69181 RepID=A0A8S9RSV0_BRACR|nr:hypothetical protein F2Q69_00028936 [Brassica cretica]
MSQVDMLIEKLEKVEMQVIKFGETSQTSEERGKVSDMFLKEFEQNREGVLTDALGKLADLLPSKVSSNRRPGFRHSTFESLCLVRSSQSITSGFLRLWDSLNFKKYREFVGITVLFLDERQVPVKVDHFEVARCSSMYKITDHSFLIRFISLTIIDEVITSAPEINFQSRLDYVVGQICYAQGSDLTKETTRVVIRLLIDP